MAKSRPYVDVVLVGGAMLGTGIAARIDEVVQNGGRVVCFRLRDNDAPSAESLRNQGLFQSGLRYLAKDENLAALMWRSRADFLLYLGYRLPPAEGIMQIGRDRVDEFLRQVRATHYRTLVAPLEEREAKKRLGRFWDGNGISFSVPEQHLPIAEILTTARAVAEHKNVQFEEIESLEVLGAAPRGKSVYLRVNGVELEAGAVVFAAGCGNIPYLEKMLPGHGYKLQQTPLLVVSGSPGVDAAVLYDRKNELSVAAHQPCEYVRQGCMIIGMSGTERIIDHYVPAMERKVEDYEAQRILDRLRERVPAVADRSRYRFTAGWEPIPSHGIHIRPQVIGFPEGHDYQSIIFAFCGRATLAFEAVNQVLARLREIVPAKYRRWRGSSQIGIPWNDRIHAHFHDYYKNFDDYRSFKETSVG